jgi:hypothetical protein
LKCLLHKQQACEGVPGANLRLGTTDLNELHQLMTSQPTHHIAFALLLAQAQENPSLSNAASPAF